MDSEKVLEWHKKDFKFYGVWPRENPTVFQFVHALLFYTIFIVMFTVSAVICVFFCNSIDAMVDNLLLSTTFVMVSIKAFNMLATKRTFFNVFRTLKELDATVTTDEHRQIFVPIFERSAFIFKCIFVQFLVNGILIVAQVLLSKPELRILSSTYLYPGEFWHNPIIYNAGIYFQLISCIFQATLDSAFDTYVGALLDLLDGHITALGRRFRALGNLSIEAELKLSVILACKKYVLILECRQLLERALSVTLFTQFGVNGLVLCTCAYQLSMISPSENPFKYALSFSYSVGMLIKTAFPAYFGSALILASESLTYDIFKSNWIGQSEQYCKMLRMLVERTLQPIYVEAGGLFQLNLTTMLKILKTAYSLFAVLRNTKNK